MRPAQNLLLRRSDVASKRLQMTTAELLGVTIGQQVNLTPGTRNESMKKSMTCDINIRGVDEWMRMALMPYKEMQDKKLKTS